MTRSLILAAHGSLAAEDSNQPLFELAKRIESYAKFDRVTPAFLIGQPAMTNVLDQYADAGAQSVGDVVIVPVMTSQGYYLKKLPSKFAENLAANRFRVFMSPVVGMHRSIPDRFADRIRYLLNHHQLNADQTTVVVIGHGTRRNSRSGESTFKLTESLRSDFHQAGQGGLKFETGFLDQDPEAEFVANNISTANTLIMPFLVSRGPHTTEDVPNAFGLPASPDLQFPVVQKSTAGVCVYDMPLAYYPGIEEVCIELAENEIQQGTPLDLQSEEALK